MTDPQVQWDPVARRWFYVALRITPTGSSLAFGWSKNANPSPLSRKGWCKFFLPTGDLMEDFPKLGHDDAHLIVGTNVFKDPFGERRFQTARISMIPKPADGDTKCTRPERTMLGSPDAPLLFPGTSEWLSTPVPANTFGPSAVGYVVAARSQCDTCPAPNRIGVFQVTGTREQPAIAAVGSAVVNAYTVPPAVPQPRTTFRLDTGDASLTQAVAVPDPNASGQLAVWTQHTIGGVDGRSALRWYDLLPASLTVVQQGNVQPAGRFAFNGAISPTASGTGAVLNYNEGGADLLPRVRGTSRDASTPLGTMSRTVTLGRSGAAYRCGAGTKGDPTLCRWGDYAGASPDPSRRSIVWGSNQLQRNTDSWVTRNFALR